MSDSKVKFKLNKAGVREILQSQMMMDAVMDAAQWLGEVDTNFVGFDRVQVIVKENGDADRTDN